MTKPKDKEFPIRLAMREEGDMWNAYLAKMDTMEGAVLIASILLAPLADDHILMERYKDLLKEILRKAVESKFGPITSWTERKPPEKDKTRE